MSKGYATPPHDPPYPLAWEVKGFERLSIVYEADDVALKELLEPTPFDLVRPHCELVIDNMLGHTLGGFMESDLAVPVRYGDVEGMYHLVTYVSTDIAILAGREVFGWPKFLAETSLERSGNQVVGRTTRYGTTLFTVEWTQDDEQAADTSLILNDKGEYIWTHHLCIRVFPKIDEPAPAFRQIIYRNTRTPLKSITPGRAKVDWTYPSDHPLSKVGPVEVLGGFMLVADVGGALGSEIRQVLDQYVNP